MAAELDEMNRCLKISGNRNLPKADRVKGRSDCLAAAGRLSRLWQQAGGTQKLTNMPGDEALSRLNYEIMLAKMDYISRCYSVFLPGAENIADRAEHENVRRRLAALR